jgi:spore germination cell wall hydrolase CwlJ-like protein
MSLVAVLCLALNIYHEARGESIDAQLLVAEVTINRSVDRNLSICETVFQPRQFSWTHDSISDIPADAHSAIAALKIAASAFSADHLHTSADHYHRYDVNPAWAKDLIILGRYGDHIFYRSKT